MSDKVTFPDKEGVSSSLGTATGEVELSKWGKEAWMKFAASGTLIGSEKVGDKYKLTYGEYAVQVYELPNGLEYEIIIGKVPSSNVFTIPISSQNLKFYYQAPLDDAKYTYPVGCVVSATHVYDADGRLITERPINVVGSYAVYHPTKRNNEYRAGKAFHIYRPLVSDAQGATIWGVLNYDGIALTVTVDEVWLSKAKYPVVIDPTIGYETAGGSWQVVYDIIYGSVFDSVPGTATLMSAYIKDTHDYNSHNAAAAIYYDTTGGTGNKVLVVGSGSVSIPGEGAGALGHWYNFDIADTVVDGTDTILVVNGAASYLYIAYDDLNVKDDWSAGQTFGSWANPEMFYLDATNERTYSIHYDYTAAGGPPAVGGLMMVPSLKGHMGYDLKTRGGKARRRIF